MKFIDWTKVYEKYKGFWVALADDNESVVGAGTTPEQALSEAHAKGFSHATLAFVPPDEETAEGGRIVLIPAAEEPLPDELEHFQNESAYPGALK